MKQRTVQVSESHHKKLKILAAKRGVQVKAVVTAVIEAGLSSEGINRKEVKA